jgi:hypothetical protein
MVSRAEILENIIKNKDNLSEASARVYTARLFNIANDLALKKIDEFASKSRLILEYVKKQPDTKAKSLLVALIAIVNKKAALATYKKKLAEYKDIIAKEENKQEKTEKQADNWESWDDIIKTYHQIEDEVLPLFKKTTWTGPNMKSMQQYVCLSLYCLTPPRRIQDYTNFKIKNINKKTDNYWDKDRNELVFNSYKTAKNYGEQRIPCPQGLETVFDLWYPIASRCSDYLLFNGYGDKLPQPTMTKLLNSIFNKKISASMLRHIYISDVVLKDAPKNTELDKVAEAMGQSRAQQNLYRKVD